MENSWKMWAISGAFAIIVVIVVHTGFELYLPAHMHEYYQAQNEFFKQHESSVQRADLMKLWQQQDLYTSYEYMALQNRLIKSIASGLMVLLLLMLIWWIDISIFAAACLWAMILIYGFAMPHRFLVEIISPHHMFMMHAIKLLQLCITIMILCALVWLAYRSSQQLEK